MTDTKMMTTAIRKNQTGSKGEGILIVVFSYRSAWQFATVFGSIPTIGFIPLLHWAFSLPAGVRTESPELAAAAWSAPSFRCPLLAVPLLGRFAPRTGFVTSRQTFAS
jgi:hypothetical protein